MEEIRLDMIKYFIFCSPKTGSTTLTKAFEKRFGKSSVFHLHSNQTFIRKMEEKKLKVDFNISDLIKNNSKKHEKIFIIDSYREPFEKSISTFFQKKDKDKNWAETTTDELINIFNSENRILKGKNHSYLESWNYFGLSTNIEFDFEKGYYLKQKDNMFFIKTRLKESWRWSEIFSEILNTKINFTDYKNVGEEKDYAYLYSEFKERYKLPEETKKLFLEALSGECESDNPFILDCKEMKKFMTPDEINDYIKKWIY